MTDAGVPPAPNGAAAVPEAGAVYGNLLVGVDGRRGGVDAAALAAVLAAPGAPRHLVFVAAGAPHTGRGADGDVHLELVDPDVLPELMGRERQLVGSGASVMRMLADSVAEGLEAAAEQCEADLVVVGASRRHGIPRLTRDDDVAALLHRTAATIAVAPTGYSDGPRRVRRIGVAFDRSPESQVARAHAGLLARALGCDLVVQTVAGSPERRLVSFEHDVDLLVCGSRRHGPLRRLVLGSTSEHLARHVEVPLIITAPVDDDAVRRWRGRESRSGVGGAT